MKAAEIERILGLPVGPTMHALVACAKNLARRHPSAAFDRLGLFLTWVKTKGERALEQQLSPEARAGMQWHYLGSPTTVLPFAHSGPNTFFGFLVTQGSTTDDCPIVRVEPGLPDSDTEVVAPTLLHFLGVLVACEYAVFSRAAEDLELLHTPAAARMDTLAREEVAKQVGALRTRIPGLQPPARPSEVIRAAPSPSFELSVPFSDPRRAKLAPSALELANGGVTGARHAIEAGAYASAVAKLERSLAHPATRPRALALRVNAQVLAGDGNGAVRDLDTLVSEWLDNTPPGEDGPHARAVVAPAELVQLLEQTSHPASARLRAQIDDAGDPPLPEGDFF